MVPAPLKDHVDALVNSGRKLEIWEHDGQCYVFVPAVQAPSPPWDRSAYDILVAVPGAYDQASLDAFYFGLPYRFNGGEHPRVNGGIVRIKERDWKLVSWHYPDGKPWAAGHDSLETHLSHCSGFFLHRGAINAY